MIIWDASKAIRRSWRQNASISLKGEDCGLVVGSMQDLSDVLHRAKDGNINVIISEYSSDMEINADKFNRYYKRTQEELIRDYINNKSALCALMKFSGVNVYDNFELNNYMTCKCILHRSNESAVVFSEFEDFYCLETEKVKINANTKTDAFINTVFSALYGTYFFDKVATVRKSTLLKAVPELSRKSITFDEFFLLVINGNLNFKQKQKIAEIMERAEANYKVLKFVSSEEEQSFLSGRIFVKERNKTKFKILNKRFGFKFSDEFIDDLFAEVNRLWMVSEGKCL